MHSLKESTLENLNEELPLYRLCKNCIHKTNCVYNQSPVKQIMFCEEFEGEKLPALQSVIVRNLSQIEEEVGAENDVKQESKLMGLCRTCEHRNSCTYPKPEGGVWNCDEFE